MNLREERVAIGAATGIFAISLVGVVLATRVTNPYTIAIPPLVGLGALAGILALSSDSHRWITFPAIDVRLVFSVWALCSALVIASVIQTGQRPLYGHAAQLIAYTLSGWVILSGRSRLGTGLTIATALVHRLTIYYASATLIGLDSLYHVRVSSAVAHAGSLVPLADSKYWFAPFTHLLLAVNQLITGAIPRDAAVLFPLAAVVVPLICVYLTGRQLFSPAHGAMAAFLLAIGDWVITWAVQPTTTTLGICLFAVTVLVLVRWRQSPSTRLFGLLMALLLAQIATHQISAFITILTIGAFVVGSSIWQSGDDGHLRQYFSRIVPLLGVLLLYSWLITRRRGPNSDFPPFLVEMLSALIRQITTRSSRPAVSPTMDVSLAGANSMTAVQMTGIAILFGLAVAGGVWLLRRRGQRSVALGLGVVVAVLSGFVFIGPIVGINFFIPRRWFAFLYIPLTLLGAVGLFALVRSIAAFTPRWTTASYVLILLLVLAPLGGTMLLGYPGAPDGPVLDQAPGAQRLGTTPEEKAAYTFVANSTGDDITVVADHVARQQIERNFGRETKYYQVTEDAPGELVFNGSSLIVDRGYDRTNHASWEIKTNRWLRVFAPMPVDRLTLSSVYDNGNNQIRYE